MRVRRSGSITVPVNGFSCFKIKCACQVSGETQRKCNIFDLPALADKTFPTHCATDFGSLFHESGGLCWLKREIAGDDSWLIHPDYKSGVVHDIGGPAESPFDRAIVFYCQNIARVRQGGLSRLTGYEADEILAHLKASGASHQALNVKWKDSES